MEQKCVYDNLQTLKAYICKQFPDKPPVEIELGFM